MYDTQPEPVDGDDLAQRREDVAERLAKLSTAAESPAGVAVIEPFEAAQVDFGSGSWQQRLLSVQGWLDLSIPLADSSPGAFVDSLSDALGVATRSPVGTPAVELLEKLHERADAAVHAQARFLEEMQGGEDSTPEAAAARWREAWEESDDSEEQSSSEPVNAAADVWKVGDFVGHAREGDINLAPSYQRSDVWALKSRQMLIESILRGIPLPSIILLNDQDAGVSYDVVDGRQRLTSILRFVGAHPSALAKVAEMEAKHKRNDLQDLFKTDYPKFKKAWKSLEGPLSAKDEEDFYFPFKLRTGGNVMQGPLEALRGKYYSQIRLKDVRTVGGTEQIRKVFEATSQYKVPVIVYTKATPAQIHEVFNLYNKQGVHLNAEEIRNAIYHELELARAILVASGDFHPRNDEASIAPSLDSISAQIGDLQQTLASYGLTAARYRRSKVVSWVFATILHRPDAPAGNASPRYGSTANHIDSFLDRVQEGHYVSLKNRAVLTDLFTTFGAAVKVHASVDEEVWTNQFKQGEKWLDLELVGSLVGVLAAATVLADGLAQAMNTSADALRLATSFWIRPDNAQSASQWRYVATIARGTVVALGVDPAEADAAVTKRFQVSGLGALFSLAINDPDTPTS